MTIDAHGVQAAAWVRGWAEGATMPSVDELLERQRQRQSRRLVRGAVVVVVGVLVAAAALALGATRRTPAASSAERYRHVEQPTLGFAVDIPATWVDYSSTTTCTGGGWLYCAERPPNSRTEVTGPGSEGLLGFHIVATSTPFTIEVVERDRVLRLRTFGATIKDTKRLRIDGHDAVKIHYLLTNRDGTRTVEDVEVDVIRDNQLAVGLIVVQDPTEFRDDLPTTILKTVRIR